VAIPELKYGVHVRRFRSMCVRFALKHATYILPNHHALIENINSYAVDHPVKGGIKSFVKKPKGKIKTIYNGFDIDFWTKQTKKNKNNVAIAVAYITNKRNFHLKGIDMFIETARLLPEHNFLLVGISETFRKKENIQLPSNCKIYEAVPQSELIKLYRSSKVFCLFSLSEGMPNVLCESMLCECIPVGTPVLAIPDIIGNTGFIIPGKKPQKFAECVEKAFLSDVNLGVLARKRITENFPLKRRERELVKLVAEIRNDKVLSK
jgi:glycosyltransferase involved in cell wall biosynthesis